MPNSIKQLIRRGQIRIQIHKSIQIHIHTLKHTHISTYILKKNAWQV